MRRLVLAATLAFVPDTAQADTWPTWFGCGKLGCYQVGIADAATPGGVVTSLTPVGVTSGYPAGYGDAGYVLTLYGTGNNVVWQGGAGYYWSAILGQNLVVGGNGVRSANRGVLKLYTGTGGSAGTYSVEEFGTVRMTTSPEPASIVLMGSGLVGLLAAGRRRWKPSDDAV